MILLLSQPTTEIKSEVMYELVFYRGDEVAQRTGLVENEIPSNVADITLQNNEDYTHYQITEVNTIIKVKTRKKVDDTVEK